MLLSPARIRADAEIAKHKHLFLMTEPHHFPQEIVLQAWLCGNDASFVPGITVTPTVAQGEGRFVI
jgi:hypothetical protein